MFAARGGANRSTHGFRGGQSHYHILWCFFLTLKSPCRTLRAILYFFGRQGTATLRHSALRERTGNLGELMQYLPGFTVQCINPACDVRGHWLRADATGPISDDGRCPGCGDMLRNVPPPLSPRFRMRPRALTGRPPLRPRPR
jgi:hypothetical protein